MARPWKNAARYQRWVTVLALLAWLPGVWLGLTTPLDAEPLSRTGPFMLLAPLALHGLVVAVGWWLSAPFPNSAIGIMLLSPLGIAALSASEPGMWLPDLAVVRAVIAVVGVGVLAWASGRWASTLVLEDTMDTSSV